MSADMEGMDALMSQMQGAPAADPGQEADAGTQQSAEAGDPSAATAEQGAQGEGSPGSEIPGTEADAKPQGVYSQEERDRAKHNAAFATMRMQNTSMQKVLGTIASKLGLDPKSYGDDQAFTQALVDAIATPQAQQPAQQQQTQQQQQPITDPAIALRIAQLERENAEVRQQANLRLTQQAFEKVKQEFSLSQEDLETFADQLIAEGVDPYQNPNLDLGRFYKLMNVDKLLEQRVATELKAQQEREQRSQEHSSKPGGVTGSHVESGGTTINSYAGLQKALEGYVPQE